MNIDTMMKFAGKFNPKLVKAVLKIIGISPRLENRLRDIKEKEYESILGSLEMTVKPYKGKFDSYSKMPSEGIGKTKILKSMREIKNLEESRWKDGFVSGAVYHGDEDHIEFLNKVYALNSQSNPLHSDVWPSTAKYEAEIVSMTADMLGTANITAEESVCGTVTSGGTESIMLAMKAYRDRGRAEKGIKRPEMIVPVSAHAAFDKASQYFNIKMVKVPIDGNFKANIKAVKKAINRNTVVIAASAPTFPHGIIDPIHELSELAYGKNIGFHTDACLGGFILPWLRKSGYEVPAFDFQLPGVTSISVDTHKYGFAAKGTSVILYRTYALRHFQFYKTTEWPGGLYFSPTFAGSRPGALSAACWAAMVSMGESGYMDAAKRIIKTAEKIRKGIETIPELYILGDPLWVIAFGAREMDIYRVMDYMSGKNWSLNGLHKPSCVHICVTLRHTGKGVAECFIRDLKAAVKFVRDHPEGKGGMAPVYGMAATIPDRTMVAELLDRYMDLLYKL